MKRYGGELLRLHRIPATNLLSCLFDSRTRSYAKPSCDSAAGMSFRAQTTQTCTTLTPSLGLVLVQYHPTDFAIPKRCSQLALYMSLAPDEKIT